MSDWDFSCPDWEARIREGRSLIPSLPIDDVQAKLAVDAFNLLRLPDVAHRPRLGDPDGAGEWFRDIVRAAFGSLIGGRRYVPELFILAPKKSSKTSYSAALMMTAMVRNVLPRASMLFVAPSKQIAQLAYEQAVGMIEEDDEGFLQKRFTPVDHLKTIKDLRTGSHLVVKAFDHKVLVGIKPVAVLVDELWEIARNSKAAGVLQQIRGGLIVHPSSLLVFITTQSDEAPRGVFKAELANARAIRDGKIKGKMLPILYEFPPEIAKDEEKWSNPAIWHMVNPNLGRPVPLSSLASAFETECAKGPEQKSIWITQHLNIEMGTNYRDDRWSGADFWDKNAAPLLTLDALLEDSDVVTVGIDGGGMDDLTGICVLGRKKGGLDDPEAREWMAWCRAWCHNIVLERRKSIASALRDFEASGHLKIVPDDSDQDVQEIADIVIRIERARLLPKKGAIGVDRIGISDIADALALRKFDISPEGARIYGVDQSFRLNSVIKTVARKLAAGNLRHDGSGLMQWCVTNARVEAHGNAEAVTKAAAGTAKIDPLIALFDAAFLMVRNPVASQAGVSYLDKAPQVLVLGGLQ